MTWQISPFGNDQFFSSNGVLAVGYKLYTYLATTTTKEAVASDFAGSAFHTNPIVLNSIGLPPGAPIYLDITKSYKFVYATDTDTDPPSSPLYTADNITVKDLTNTLSEWVLGTTPTYISGTSFSLVGDQRTAYHVGRRVKCVAAGSTVYGVISASVFGAVTTITVLVDDGLTISASLNTVYYSFLSDAGSSWPAGFNTGLKTTLNAIDARTNTVNNPLEINAQTTGTPNTNIGTGILLRAESGDEAPSDFGQLDFSASNITAGLEATYFRVWLRIAGAVLTECWRWAATGAFKGIFTHANTADRTYYLPNRDLSFGMADDGPSSTGSGSTAAHEGTPASSTGALDGIHFYTDFTLDAAHTKTLDALSQRLIIIATGTITINGTITATGKGSAGGVGGNAAGTIFAGTRGGNGFSQPGGGGGNTAGGGSQPGGVGGGVYLHSVLMKEGGAGTGAAGTSQTGDALLFAHPFSIAGGAGGSGGGGRAGGEIGGDGGAGGGSVVLIAPSVVFGAASVITTTGGAGTNGAGANAGGGGGGGAGNLYVFCRSFTDNGVTFTATGGAGGAPTGAGVAGGAGAAGVKQIMIYA